MIKNTYAGIPAFISPKMINEQEIEIGKRSDVWSLAVWIFYLIEAKLRFRGLTELELKKAIIYNEPSNIEKNVPHQLKDFIMSMFTKDHYSRPTMEQLRKNPIFKNFLKSSNFAFQSMKSILKKTTKQLIIERGIELEKNIYEMNELYN